MEETEVAVGDGSKTLGSRWQPRWVCPEIVPRPPRCWGHTLSYASGKLYVVGGNAKSRDSAGLVGSEVVCIDAMTWKCRRIKTSGPNPGGRDSHTATVIGQAARQRIVVFGGTDGDRKFNELHTLDLRNMVWTVSSDVANSPSARESHTATLVHDKIVIFGGSGYFQHEDECAHGQGAISRRSLHYLNDVHFLDTGTMQWVQKEVRGAPPRPRDTHAAAALGTKLVVFGGDCHEAYVADVHVLDTTTLGWKEMKCISEEKPEARAGHVMIPYASGIMVFGGLGADGSSCHDCWLLTLGPHAALDLREGECFWKEIHFAGKLPSGCFAHAADFGDDALFVYGGLRDELTMDDLRVLLLHEDALQRVEKGKRSLAASSVRPPAEIDIRPGEGDNIEVTMSVAATRPGEAKKLQEASDMADNAGQQPHAEALRAPSTSNAFPGAAISGGSKRTRSHGTEQHPREGKVTSYNIFCTSVRKEMKRENPQTPAREIERLIGQRWQQMTMDEKKPYEDEAAQHNAYVTAQSQGASVQDALVSESSPGDLPNVRMYGRDARLDHDEQERFARREEQQAEMNAKREKFRSAANVQDQQSFNSKLNPKALLQGGLVRPPTFGYGGIRGGASPYAPSAGMALGSAPGEPPPGLMMPGNPAAHGGNLQQSEGGAGTVLHSPQPRMLGAPIEGTVDGMFDSGYLATVRVAGVTYRAMLFSPYLSVSANEVSHSESQVPPSGPSGSMQAPSKFPPYYP